MEAGIPAGIINVITGPGETVGEAKVFGPVVGTVPFDTREEAVALASDTRYGLSASIWTKDLRSGMVMAGQIKAGTIWLNEHL